MKQSSEYEDAFDVDEEDGDSPVTVPYKASDAGVFPGALDAGTNGGEVRVGLAVLTQLIETNEEDNPAYEQVLGVVSGLAEAVAAVLGATGVGAAPAAVSARRRTLPDAGGATSPPRSSRRFAARRRFEPRHRSLTSRPARL